MLSPGTGSKESMNFIRDRLQQCDKAHEICKASRPQSRWYPTRLIDMGRKETWRTSKQNPRLVLPSEVSIEGPYISLSHCWGDPGLKPLTLTLENLDSMCRGIEPASLPPTFSEAVTVIQEIGIRYIWIDSLCIIQNSTQDWENEAKMMLQVYQYAYLNIAATHSRNSQQGLFRARNPKALASVVVATEHEGSQVKFRIEQCNEWHHLIDESPLNRRASTLR